MVFYAPSTTGMSATTTGQESSTCWSSTIHWRRKSSIYHLRNNQQLLLHIKNRPGSPCAFRIHHLTKWLLSAVSKNFF